MGHPTPARLREWPAMDVPEAKDDESVARSDDGGLSGCVVSLAGIAAGKDWPTEMRDESRTFTLTAQAGRFEPHLAWVRVGTQVIVVSRTKDFAVHAFEGPSRKATLANFGLPAGGTVADSAGLFLDRPLVVYLTDDARNHFTAWIHVSPHPYVAITGDGGTYRLDDVPAGVYEVVSRHEPMDRKDSFLDRGKHHAGYLLGPMIEVHRRVRVRAGEATTADFDVRSPDER